MTPRYRLANPAKRPVSSHESPAPDVFAVVRNTLLVSAVYLYFIGWIYVYYYYDHFGLSLYAVEIPVYYFFAFSHAVVGNALTLVLAVLALIVIVKTEFLRSNLRVFVVLVALFPIFFLISREVGTYRAQQLRQINAKPVKFVFKGDAKLLVPPEFANANEREHLRLLYQTKDRYFVFLQPPGEETVLARATTYAISHEDILMASIKLDNVSAGGREWLKILDW